MDFFLLNPYIFMSWKCGLCLLAGMVNLVDSLECTDIGGWPFRSPHQLNVRILRQ